MHKFFTSKAISVLSILISLAAIVFSTLVLIENEFEPYDGYILESLVLITLFIFGLFSLTQKISFLKIQLGKNGKFHFLFTVNLILLILTIILAVEQEVISIFLVFLSSWVVTLHYYFFSKMLPNENLNDQSMNFNKVLLYLKSVDYFKLFIVGAIVFYLIIQHEKSKNGRYMSYDNQNEIIDTRTGFVYEIETDYVGGVRLYEPQLPEY